ncbi:hypothetical protein C4573_02425 [Candidatus Woesearchaeota archaeon]|nr:MAG: hypothetical protein C4573_02425 [Candidatus Woesearchaeota archaeon]
MLWVFAIKDKTGRVIHLSKERWSHIQKHPEMSGKLEHIKEALQKPQLIQGFSYDPAMKFYYNYDKSEKKYLFISVKYLNGEGFVITSFFTDRIK